MPSGVSLPAWATVRDHGGARSLCARIHALNPFKRERKFFRTDRCVISSIAGLGDLFIHLPLIGGLVKSAVAEPRGSGVALRPAHLEIGRACCWRRRPLTTASKISSRMRALFDPWNR